MAQLKNYSEEDGIQNYLLINQEKKMKKKKYSDSGSIQVLQCEIVKEHTFVEYLQGGMHLSLMIGIDFTASNGDPSFATSLHYRNPYSLNEYTKVLLSVAEVLSTYDTDQSFPLFGFGAIPNGNDPDAKVSHCFPLNGDLSHPEVQGVAGILEAYNYALDHITLQGPTIFSEIIQRAMLQATYTEQTFSQGYTVLLLICDGTISDMNDTISTIIKASELPLSIIIIGVGDTDFRNMDILDANREPLQYNGQRSVRDIVKFIPFSRYKNCSTSKMAEDILKEIPEQVKDYFQLKNTPPLPRQPTFNKPIQVDPNMSTVRLNLPNRTNSNNNRIRRPTILAKIQQQEIANAHSTHQPPSSSPSHPSVPQRPLPHRPDSPSFSQSGQWIRDQNGNDQFVPSPYVYNTPPQVNIYPNMPSYAQFNSNYHHHQQQQFNSPYHTPSPPPYVSNNNIPSPVPELNNNNTGSGDNYYPSYLSYAETHTLPGYMSFDQTPATNTGYDNRNDYHPNYAQTANFSQMNNNNNNNYHMSNQYAHTANYSNQNVPAYLSNYSPSPGQYSSNSEGSYIPPYLSGNYQ